MMYFGTHTTSLEKPLSNSGAKNVVDLFLATSCTETNKQTNRKNDKYTSCSGLITYFLSLPFRFIISTSC